MIICRSKIVLNQSSFKRYINSKHIQDDGVASSGRKKSILSFLNSEVPKPGTLILVRHGECESNTDRKFTGWIDSDLSQGGVLEVEHAARLLLERGHKIDVTYTSILKRSIRSAWIIMKELDQIYRPIIKTWRLNERMYGVLEGLSKPELAALVGEEQVQLWRAGLVDHPPSMTEEHPFWHRGERKYKNIPAHQLPLTESLQDTLDRTVPIWHENIFPDLKAGRNVMIVAHHNSLRAIVKEIDKLDTPDVQKLAIPCCIPLVYKFDQNMKPVSQSKAVPPLSGEYLEKRGLLKEALAKEEELAQKIEGYKEVLLKYATDAKLPHSASLATIKSLSKLEEQRKLLNQLFLEDSGVSVKQSVASSSQTAPSSSSSSSSSPSITTPPINGASSSKSSSPSISSLSSSGQPLLVIIRHGKTEHNKLGLFTGWEDAPLALEGKQEATHAGRLMQQHGLQFDIVYTSWLSRAIETAWLAMQEMDDCLWLPVVKSWRLNERMYGALTGLSKKMIKQRHGPEQFINWRRGFDSPPPKVSSFSHYYPGNDEKYVRYAQDIPVSWFESIIRSLAHGRFEIHRQFPRAESLKDCMERTIPYFKNVIVPNSLDKNQRVLVSSSENAIRGLLMHLCDIPSSHIHQVEIPTGLPMIYDPVTKRVRLLEDVNESQSPFTKYNFGNNPDLLFKPEDMDSSEFREIISDARSSRYGEPSEERVRLTNEYDPIIRLRQL